MRAYFVSWLHLHRTANIQKNMAHPPCDLSSSLSSLGVGRAAAAAASRTEHHDGGIFGAAAGRHRRRALVALVGGRSVADKRLGRGLVVSGSGRVSAFVSWSRSGGGDDVLEAAVGLAMVMKRRKRACVLKTQAVSSGKRERERERD